MGAMGMDWKKEAEQLATYFQQADTAVAQAVAAREQIRGALAFVQRHMAEAPSPAPAAAAEPDA